MDAIRAEIARKRKQLLESNIIVSWIKIHNLFIFGTIAVYLSWICQLFFQQPSEKYFRRGDLLKKEEEDYQKKYGSSGVSEQSEAKAHGGSVCDGMYISLLNTCYF